MKYIVYFTATVLLTAYLSNKGVGLFILGWFSCFIWGHIINAYKK